ncbi:MAG TPA: hypothetical protein VL134_11025, partial [Leptolyngbya sp.]|nr:hypothetical protein [Leptolyngbya sp.]
MVQEHNYPPRKAEASDVDSARHPDPLPVPPKSRNTSGTPLTDIASGLALLLSVVAFFLSCYAVIQSNNNRRSTEPAPSPQSNSIEQPVSRPVVPSLAQFQQVAPGRYLQPTQDKSGEVELLSANRIPASGRS